MTSPAPVRRSARPPVVLPLTALRARARADAGLLAVSAVVVALAAALAVAVPLLGDRAADRTVVAAVAADPDRSSLVVEVSLGEGAGDRGLDASSVPAAARAQAAAVEEAVPRAFGPPVAVLGAARLATQLASGEQGLTSLRLVHPWRQGETGVRWTSGGPAPRSTADGDEPLAVGLAEPVAAALGVAVGDSVPAVRDQSVVPLVVSGTFVPVDVDDPVWASAPGLLAPRTSGAGLTTATDVAALVGDDQVAHLVALPLAQPVLTTTLRARPRALGGAGAVRTARALSALEAAPAADLPGLAGAGARVRTDLDRVLLAASAQVVSARAQASVLLAALLVTTGGVVVLAAAALAQRRAAGLALLRARGSTLLTAGAEAAAEAAVVVLLAASAGAVLGGLAASGSSPSTALRAATWSLPLVVLAVAAPAALAVRAASGPDRVHRARRTAGAVRSASLVLDAAVVLLAGLALVALLGGPAGGAAPSRGPLAAAAVPLGALAAGLVARRALVPLLPAVRSRAARGRRVLPVVVASRAAEAARRSGAAAVAVLATGCATAALVLGATLQSGLVAGSWQAVGADATLTGPPDWVAAAVGALVRGTPVDGGATGDVVTGRVEEAQLRAADGAHDVRLVVAAPGGLRRLLHAGGAGGQDAEAALRRLAAEGAHGGGALPVLLSDPGALPRGGAGAALQLRWQGLDVDVTALPVAGPPWGGDGELTAVVDPTALAAATGTEAPATTAWLLGPAASAVEAAAARDGVADGVQLVRRGDRLAELSAVPTTRAVLGLALLTAVALTALGALGVLLDAAAGAPARRAQARALRVLGVPPRGRRAAAVAEVVPPVLAAGLVGTAAGVGLAAVVRAPLALQLLTGELARPALAVPWWCVVPAAAVLVTAVGAALAPRLR